MMKHPLAILFMSSLMTLAVSAQGTTTPVQKPSDSTVHKQVLPSPESIRPKPANRPSTAEAGPLRAGWKPLPQLPALSLVDRNGKAVSLATSTDRPRHWFLLYRTSACVPCDRLMLALQGSTSPELKAGKPYVIVVDSADKDALERVHAGFSNLSDATWAADREKQTSTALKLHGSPVLIAMDGDRVKWRVAGSLDGTDTMLRMTNAWLAQNASTTGEAPAVSWSEANRAAIAAQLAAAKAPAIPPNSKPTQ